MNFGEYLDYLIQQLKEENRLGYAESFKGLKSSLIRYCDSLDFQFTHIDQQWLKGNVPYPLRKEREHYRHKIPFSPCYQETRQEETGLDCQYIIGWIPDK